LRRKKLGDADWPRRELFKIRSRKPRRMLRNTAKLDWQRLKQRELDFKNLKLRQKQEEEKLKRKLINSLECINKKCKTGLIDCLKRKCNMIKLNWSLNTN
jgi:hypothetical protein